MIRKSFLLATAIVAFISYDAISQSEIDLGSISGNVQVLWQQYNEDSIIGAAVNPEKSGFNAFGNLIYQRGNFTAGMRFESYMPAILGYPGRFNGTGIGYRFARYTHEKFDVTIGNFYDQFGSGLIYRTYEERNLGIDNSMDGFRVVFRPLDGVRLTGIYGHQRLDFDSKLINDDAVVRGGDGEVFVNDLFPSLVEKPLKVTLGGSYISKFQTGGVIEKDTLLLELPENVAAAAGRINLMYKGFNLYAEYVEKINDPNADNSYIYKDGQGIFLQGGYSMKGFGVNVGAKTVDNMSFRSDRDLKLFDVPINYIPAITKQHTYNLAATLYPYATVINGESSYMAEVFYKFKKNTLLGGKYGTNISVNFAAANSLDTTHVAGVDGLIDGYRRNSWGFGDTKYVRDLNIEIKKKINKKLKLILTYYYFEFNTLATPVTTDFKGIVYANIGVAEVNWKIKPKHSLRVEAQGLFTEQDKGDWATALIEYTWSPHWFFSIVDQYNYGNDDPDKRVHYVYASAGYINGSNRISIGYGKRREGIFCIGGVCRAVPASNGLELTITSTF